MFPNIEQPLQESVMTTAQHGFAGTDPAHPPARQHSQGVVGLACITHPHLTPKMARSTDIQAKRPGLFYILDYHLKKMISCQSLANGVPLTDRT